ncbi:cation diffusion facilitator family transporter [Paraburkholderia sp. J12]|uniref:cation diffusion facilitator family transporter n=1 Tax=Paraburkholderia sp. J12 TaxID=2805432 RepID=UPI002ABD5F7C|nr:cation diffusion facilitator family transporter [Paraburkholderia sp. J12]
MNDPRKPRSVAEEREDEHAPVWLDDESKPLHDHAHEHEHEHEHGPQAHAGHSHGGGHGHHHHHAPVAGQGRAFALAVALNVTIVFVQAVYGVVAHSTALLADAGHNLSDVLGLLLAWGAIWLTKRRPSARFTFGFGSSSILASLANAALLLVACGVIIAEAIRRLVAPAPVAGLDVFVVAVIGMVVNGFSAWLFMRGSKDDLNVRGAFMHMAADAGVSAAVAVSGLVIYFMGWNWIDPVMSIAVVLVIVYGTWGLLTESVRLALAAVPAGVDVERIRVYLAAQEGVTDVHDLHIWALSTTGNALSAHLVMPAGHPGDAVLDGMVDVLRTRYEMKHVTLQVDMGTSQHRCALDSVPHTH